ncbi:lipoyl synthase [Candidatus Riesia sp. GBBU]|nr:lipoyl synthase [Candidatus Riesia sp. GBBU]
MKKKILKKPKWIKIKIDSTLNNFKELKKLLRKYRINTVCEEASCPNIFKCFQKKTASFMILGNICTRRCNFCNVRYGSPNKVDYFEPKRLAKIIKKMNLNHVVVTSVNRDDLPDGGAEHFAKCIKEIRKKIKNVIIEILVPDFHNCADIAVEILKKNPADIFSHNIETVPRIYKKVKPGSSYLNSLNILKKFKDHNPFAIIKSSIMVGLGEKVQELIEVMKDLKNHGVEMITIGQYLKPSKNNLNIQKYITPKEFSFIEKEAYKIGFLQVLCNPLARSSYLSSEQLKKAKAQLKSKKLKWALDKIK